MFKSRQVFLALVVVLTAAGCSRPQPDTSEVIRPVRVMQVLVGESKSMESYPAQVEPRFDSTLSFQVGGRLLERPAEVGNSVKEGQVLARLDPKDLRLALEAAQAQLQAAETEFSQTSTDLDRAKELKQQGFVSQAELDRRQLAFDAASSRLRQAKAQLSVQANQSRYGSLTSPRAGVITAVFAEVGQVLAPGQPVVSWADDKAVQVRISVPETRIDSYQAGRQSTVKLWSNDQELQASIREVSPVADPVTRTYSVYLDVLNPGPEVRFGMSATVLFSHSRGDERVKIPASSVVADGLGAFVWIFDEGQGVVVKQRIKATEVTADGVLIDKGLQGGELIVVAGTHLLNEGQKVKRFVEAGEIKAELERRREEAQPK